MPLYEYFCPNCGREVEIIQKVDDEAPICEHQDGFVEDVPIIIPYKMIKKLSKPSGFILKGTGWYRDGYASKAKK